jgi:hypothetical protein
MSSRKGRASDDLCFERRVFAAYGTLCEIFFYTKLVGVMHQNWDRTSRQAAIRNLVEAQPLYLQPESIHDQNSILMVNDNGRGIGHLEERTAEEISRSLRSGREWHAHVRSVKSVDGAQGCEVVVMMLLMVTPERYAELVQERKVMDGESPFPLLATAGTRTKDFSVEWTLVALLLLGVAITML